MATSYNGWSASPNLRLRPLVVAGESFSPGIRDDDDVHTVLGYVAQQMHQRVEPIDRRGWHHADDWGFYYRSTTGGTSLSNHASGTAIDYNATRHPYGVPTSRNFSQAQINEVHKILGEVDHTIRWGGDYSGTPDAMHFEVNVNAATLAGAARKIRQKERDDMEYKDWSNRSKTEFWDDFAKNFDKMLDDSINLHEDKDNKWEGRSWRWTIKRTAEAAGVDPRGGSGEG